MNSLRYYLFLFLYYYSGKYEIEQLQIQRNTCYGLSYGRPVQTFQAPAVFGFLFSPALQCPVLALVFRYISVLHSLFCVYNADYNGLH